MPNFNIDADPKHTYDAIVIGSGISGGWAAKELCEKGYYRGDCVKVKDEFCKLTRSPLGGDSDYSEKVKCQTEHIIRDVSSLA